MQIKETFKDLDKIALVANVYDSEKYFDQLIKAEENKIQTKDTALKLKELHKMK